MDFLPELLKQGLLGLLTKPGRKEAAMPNKRKREKKTIDGVKYERYEGDDIWVTEATK